MPAPDRRPHRPLLDDNADLSGIDIALFSAGASTSRAWASKFIDAGAVVIDNSSAFRRDPSVPLVVSEVNPHALANHRGLIANPNCSTMQLMVALAPIQRAVGIERLVVSTYQSVSGTGKKAIDELDAQAQASLNGLEMPAPELYPDHIAFNVIGAAGNFAEGDDHTDEERKMMFETRKILEDESIGIAVTCVRVPVRVSHSIAVNVQTREPITADGVRELLADAPGIALEHVPSPLHGRGPRRGLRGTDPRRRLPSPRAVDVGRLRQPAQGRRHQRGPDRGAARRRRRRRLGRRRLTWPGPIDLYEVMRCAPSTRDFTDEPVPREVLERVLDNARYAPSGGNRQGWRVIVITDPDIRRRLRELYQEPWDAYMIKTGGRAALDAGEASGLPEGRLRMLRGADEYARRFDEVPVHLLVVRRRQRPRHHRRGP